MRPPLRILGAGVAKSQSAGSGNRVGRNLPKSQIDVSERLICKKLRLPEFLRFMASRDPHGVPPIDLSFFLRPPGVRHG